MSQKIAYATPAAAVAQNGTITFSYPDGTTAGDYATFGHSIVARGLGLTKFSQDLGTISVSFGASDITVTYKGATSIPANSTVVANFNIRGLGRETPPALLDINRASYANIVRLELGAPDTADPDGIVESQNLTAAGVYSTLAFNGVYGDPYGNAYAILDVPRNVVAAWTTPAILTVTGEDEYGDVVIEASASGTSFTGKKAFKKITSIAVSTNVTSLTVGTGDVLGLPAYVANASQILAELQDNVIVGNGGFDVIRLTIDIADLSADADYYLPLPGAGQILKLTSIIDGVVGTADVTITPLIVGGSAMTGGVLTITQSGSAAGDIDTATPTANFTYAAGGALKLTVAGGGSGGSPRGHVIVEIAATSLVLGTFVGGVQTTPTPTTGDVRGTYDPYAACDNSKQFALLVALPEPNYRGVDNYDG